MQHPDGTVTQTRYLPFGGYRDGSGGNPMTDRGYTGHKHNDDLGLIYMNARFYVPGIARFASADTIVPDPTNPQSFNRYSYVRNNPLGFTDPSGHSECGVGQYQCEGDVDRFAVLKNQYERGDDFVFAQTGSSGVNRYVEIDVTVGIGSFVFPFDNHGGTDTVFNPLGITFESGIGVYGGLGGGLTGQLDASSFATPHLNPKFEAETGNGIGGKILGFEVGVRKTFAVNTDGTHSIEYALSGFLVGGTGGVNFDPDAIIVRPSAQLARDLARGIDDAWQKLYRATYGSSSVLPTSAYAFVNTVHVDPVFPDYGGFLPIHEIATGYPNLIPDPALKFFQE